MARRSLQASIAGIHEAKQAFQTKLWTQGDLATEVGIETRQPIWKFFTGKPIERQIFMEICFKLGLDWQEIADAQVGKQRQDKESQLDGCLDIDTLVQVVRLRRQEKIKAQCATLRLLYVSYPINIKDIYININILENISNQRWVDVSELRDLDREELNFLCPSQFWQKRVPAMQAIVNHSKLMVLGKPGSGKTTFLQNLAVLCNQNQLLPDCVPIFVRLRNFAEDTRKAGSLSLLNYISQELSHCGIVDEQVKTLLHHGRILILLDGLDEIQFDDRTEIIRAIRRFSEDHYQNHVIVTCRTATHNYRFEGFTEVEIADFDQSQIEDFAEKWFAIVDKNSEGGLAKINHFIQNLQLSENWQIRELGVTPLLLSLICSVFQSRLEFTTRRGELYKQGLEFLLSRWDEERNIKRDEGYPLSLLHKVKLLSKIAAIAFEKDQYFFTQSSLQQYIADYLKSLSADETELEELRLSSEAVLKSLEAQHGIIVERACLIYSFSHLTFQEYLTARNFVDASHPDALEGELLNLVSHLTEYRWRNIFLLTAGMLNDASYLLELMKQRVDELVATEESLQQFLIWLDRKSLSIHTPYKSTAVRAFYLTLVVPHDFSLARNLNLAVAIDPKLAGDLVPELAMDVALTRALSLSLGLVSKPTLKAALDLSFVFNDNQVFEYDSGLLRSLRQLKEQLPILTQNPEGLKEWWSIKGSAWVFELKSLMLRYRNLGHQWEFSDQQKKVLEQYYTANQLLVDCLKASCDVPASLQAEIEDMLLRPNTRMLDYELGKYVNRSEDCVGRSLAVNTLLC